MRAEGDGSCAERMKCTVQLPRSINEINLSMASAL